MLHRSRTRPVRGFRPPGSSGDFPLAWERLLWSGRPRWFGRFIHFRQEYHLTDFRAVIRRGHRTVAELAVHDLDRVEFHQTETQRFCGASTLVLRGKDGEHPIVFADIRQGPQLALVLELLAEDPAGFDVDSSIIQLIDDGLGPESLDLFGRRRGVLAAAAMLVALVAGLGAVTLRRHSMPSPIAYPVGDAIYPEGRKRSRAEIVEFMENEVMPFARQALGPLAGGTNKVTCFTCHASDAESRDWHMPAVRALPEPDLRLAGMERYGANVDSQLRNAVYGYLAEDDKQHRAAYMRGVVMPGMARLLGRPAYDFTKPYDYNRARSAFGCYHCHMISAAEPGPAALTNH